jgi:hypothetical protein
MRGLYLFALAATLACASGGAGGAGSGPAVDRNVITETELRSLPSSSLYDFIEKSRPNFLRSRGASSINAPESTAYAKVYVDGNAYGEIGSLRSIVTAQVQQVRYYDAISAQQKYGMTSSNGVIEVTTKR